VSVTVRDAATGALIYDPVIYPTASGPECTFYGGPDAPGVFDVDAVWRGEHRRLHGIALKRSGCHVRRRELTIRWD
jgi:hypothetical protein